VDSSKPYVQTYLQLYGARKVEANALVTKIDAGRQLCRNAIQKYLNDDLINDYKEATNDARKELQTLIDKMIMS